MINQKTFAAAVRQRAEKTTTLRDAQVPGLLLAVGKRSASWRFQYKPRGLREDGSRHPTKTLGLGSHDELTVEEARAVAVAAKAVVAAGGDPAAEKRLATTQRVAERQASRTCRDILPLFAADLAERKGDTEYTKSLERGARAVLEALGVMGLAPADIAVKPVGKYFRDRQGTTWKIRHLSLRMFLDFCAEEDLVDGNVAMMAQRPKKGPERTRFLSADELRTVWHEAEALDPSRRDLMRFLISVPCRLGEALNLTWDQIQGDVWLQSGTETKNGNPHQFALHPLALGILDGCPKDTKAVFPSSNGHPITSRTHLREAIFRATSSVTDWQLHDLRRTFATHLGDARVKFSEAAVDAVLNHRQAGTRGGVLGVYQQSERRQEQSAIMQTWGQMLADIIDGRTPDNVVRLA